MFLARDLWHSTSGQSSCSLSPCFAKFFSESSYSYVFRSVYVLVLLFPYIVSVFKYLEPHSLKRTPF